MSVAPYYMLKMQRAETQVRQEIEREQITHPLADYDEARVARLVEQMEEAKTHTWPSDLTFNV